jgi:hypothetical protein
MKDRTECNVERINGKMVVHWHNSPIDLGDEVEIVAFHHYPTVVMDRVLEIEYGECTKQSHNMITRFRDNLVHAAVVRGINAHVDNKIAFELKHKDKTFYVGFKDGKMSIGFSVHNMR